MFIDEAKIYVKAGAGGNGCRSFYRDKYTRQGIPDGGSGGRGGDIITLADKNLASLLDFHYRRHFIASHGKHGSGNNRKGRDALPVIIRLPCGTVIKDATSGCVLADLTQDYSEVVIAQGGRGGRGNNRNQSVTKGSPGQERHLLLELKLIADVGIIGLPNAGKSTLINAVSRAHSKIAAYPFTTRFPVLGVVKQEGFSFVLADIPGLIKGSCLGRGLGDKFLRHIERTRVILHLIDIAATEGRDPFEDYATINKELGLFNKELMRRRQIIVANKMDLPGTRDNLRLFKKKLKQRVYCVSALKKEGLEELIEAIRKRLSAHRN